MVAIVLVICLAVFTIAALIGTAIIAGPSRPVKQRLDALSRETAPAQAEQDTADIRRKEQLSGIGWLNRWIVRANLAPTIRLYLHQADMKTAPETLLLTSVAGSVLTGFLVCVRTSSLLSAVFLSAAFVPMPFLYLLRKRTKRFDKFDHQLPEAIDMLVSALRVGHSLVAAIGALGQEAAEPLAGEFRKLFDEQNFGLDLRTAMMNLATRVPLQDVRIFVAAALIQKESGGNLAEVLEKVAHTTRERFRVRKQIMVHTAQGRLTGWILSLLPVVLGIGMYLVNPEGMSVLWTNPIGLRLLITAMVMIVVGCLIIRKIVRIRV
jgi:tight adherence protein B